MVGTQHHALVNVLGTGNTVGQNTYCLVDHRDKDTVNDKAGSLVNGHRGLADLGGQVNDALCGLLTGELALDNLNERHAVGRVEEVATDELSGTAGACGNLGNRERRRVGSEDGLGLADLVKLHEHIFLQLHVLDCSLDNEVSIGEVSIVGRRGDICQDGLHGILGDFAFLHELVVTLGNRSHSLVQALLSAALHDNGHLGGKRLDDTLSHRTCSNNTDFHNLKLFY